MPPAVVSKNYLETRQEEKNKLSEFLFFSSDMFGQAVHRNICQPLWTWLQI